MGNKEGCVPIHLTPPGFVIEYSGQITLNPALKNITTNRKFVKFSNFDFKGFSLLKSNQHSILKKRQNLNESKHIRFEFSKGV